MGSASGFLSNSCKLFAKSPEDAKNSQLANDRYPIVHWLTCQSSLWYPHRSISLINGCLYAYIDTYSTSRLPSPAPIPWFHLVRRSSHSYISLDCSTNPIWSCQRKTPNFQVPWGEGCGSSESRVRFRVMDSAQGLVMGGKGQCIWPIKKWHTWPQSTRGSEKKSSDDTTEILPNIWLCDSPKLHTCKRQRSRKQLLWLRKLTYQQSSLCQNAYRRHFKTWVARCLLALCMSHPSSIDAIYIRASRLLKTLQQIRHGCSTPETDEPFGRLPR